MQSQKESHFYKFQQYEVQIKIVDQNLVDISVIDLSLMVLYADKKIKLQNIGSIALCKAFQIKNKEIQMQCNHNNLNQALEFTITVNTSLFKVIEIISIKKLQKISQNKILVTKIKQLDQQLKIKQKLQKTQDTCFAGTQLQENYYKAKGGQYHHLCKIQLPRGKYILNFSFLVKTPTSFVYIFFHLCLQLLQRSSFNIPITKYFVPLQFRKIYIVTKQKQTVSFTTSYAPSHPFIIRNAIITAQRIDQNA